MVYLALTKELAEDNYKNGNLAFDENRALDLRSIIKESIDLPAEVLRADFSHVYDRILDQTVYSSLTTPSSSETETLESSERYHRRREALTPYLDKRLICVCIRLPGIVYSIEIDPAAEKVIHWEWQSV